MIMPKTESIAVGSADGTSEKFLSVSEPLTKPPDVGSAEKLDED